MTYLLDSDTCIHWLRGNETVRRHFIRIDRKQMFITFTTVMELRYGAACSLKPEANHSAIDSFVAPFTVLSSDDATAHIFAAIKSDLRIKGQLIEDFDIVNAATALRHDFILVTNNLRHFTRVPNLLIESWR